VPILAILVSAVSVLSCGQTDTDRQITHTESQAQMIAVLPSASVISLLNTTTLYRSILILTGHINLHGTFKLISGNNLSKEEKKSEHLGMLIACRCRRHKHRRTELMSPERKPNVPSHTQLPSTSLTCVCPRPPYQ